MKFIKKTALLLLIAFVSTAQGQEFGGGLILGASTSQLSGDQLGGFDKIGLITGVYTNRSLSKSLNLKMELKYIEKGSKNPENNITGQHEYSLNYMEIPLIIQYKSQPNIYIEFGGYLGILTHQNESYADGVAVTGVNPSNGSFNKTDYGFCIGLDYFITSSLSINSRFSNTLFFTPIRNHASSAKIWYNQGQYNTILSFSIQYHLL